MIDEGLLYGGKKCSVVARGRVSGGIWNGDRKEE